MELIKLNAKIKKLTVILVILSTILTLGCVSKDKTQGGGVMGEKLQTNEPAVSATTVGAVVAGANAAAATTDWQAKLETDIQNPNYEYRTSIEHLTGKNKALVPAATTEIVLGNSIYLTEISIDRINWVVSGYIENKGTTPISAAGINFFPVTKDYTPCGFTEIRILNDVNILTTGYGDLQIVKPGQKLSFKTHLIENDPRSSQKFLEDQKTAPFLAVEYKE